jgi:PAS domain S-box-containing protein
MRTPSLRLRVTLASLAVLVTVLGGLNVFLYLTLRRTLMHNLDDVLATRADVVRAEAERSTIDELPGRLTQLGIRATVTAPDGRTLRADPLSPDLGTGLPPRVNDLGGHPASRIVTLPAGGKAVVFARRTGIDDALSNLLLFEALGSAMALIVATLLLRRITAMTLRPIEHMAAAARRVAAGQRGERLAPDRPTTPLGELATAYDAMLDDLESAITASRDAQARSDRLYEHTRTIIDTAQKAFVAMDAGGRIIDWNLRAEELFGWRGEEVIGRTVSDTLVPPSLRQQHVDGIARFLATGEGPLVGKPVELDALHHDGTTIPVGLTVWATSDDALTFNAFVDDIRERRRGAEAVARLAAIVESARDAVLSQDLDGTILSWNHSAELVYGYTADEAIGQPVDIVVPPGEADARAILVEEVRQGRAIQTLETVRRTKNGTLIDVALTISPVVDGSGAVVGISTVARDITEQRWMARTLDSTLVALESALEQARRSEARSRRFLADAAHQLRSPITGIRACSETLLRGVPETERDRLMMHLVRETSRSSRLLGGLLRLARLDEGHELAPEPSDLAALCEGEAERARTLAPHLEIVVDASGRPATAPDLDRAAMQEILGNLVDNARRHAIERIDLTVSRAGETVEVRVTDDGPGMTAEEAERAFERFVSLDGRGGSGLGLPIARALAVAQGGDLRYEASQKAFVLRLPLRTDTARDQVAARPGQPAAAGG